MLNFVLQIGFPLRDFVKLVITSFIIYYLAKSISVLIIDQFCFLHRSVISNYKRREICLTEVVGRRITKRKGDN